MNEPNTDTAPHRRMSLLRNLSLTVIALLVSLLLVDLLLPFVFPMTKTTLCYDPLLGLKGRAGIKTPWTREVDPVVGRLKVQLNSFGFHDTEYSLHKPPGMLRIIDLGDSYVEAYQVPLRLNFSKVLEQNLNQHPLPSLRVSKIKHIEVLNQGIHGYGLGTYYLYVNNRMDGWSPDVLVLCIFLGNDLEDNFHQLAAPAVPSFTIVDSKLKLFPPRYDLSTWVRDNVLAHSNLAILVRESGILSNSAFRVFARRHDLVSFAYLRPLSAQQKAEMLALADLQMASIREHCDKHNVALFVLLLPDFYRVLYLVDSRRVPRNDQFVTPEDRVALEQGVIKILSSHHIPFVYPLDRFVSEVRAGRQMYIRGAGHLTAAGHRVVEDAIEPSVRQLLQEKTTPSRSSLHNPIDQAHVLRGTP